MAPAGRAPPTFRFSLPSHQPLTVFSKTLPHLMLLQGGAWKEDIALGTSHQMVVGGVLQCLRPRGERQAAQHLLAPWRLQQGPPN